MNGERPWLRRQSRPMKRDSLKTRQPRALRDFRRSNLCRRDYRVPRRSIDFRRSGHNRRHSQGSGGGVGHPDRGDLAPGRCAASSTTRCSPVRSADDGDMPYVIMRLSTELVKPRRHSIFTLRRSTRRMVVDPCRAPRRRHETYLRARSVVENYASTQASPVRGQRRRLQATKTPQRRAGRRRRSKPKPQHRFGRSSRLSVKAFRGKIRRLEAALCFWVVLTLDPDTNDGELQQSRVPVGRLDHNGDGHTALNCEGVNGIVRSRPRRNFVLHTNALLHGPR